MALTFGSPNLYLLTLGVLLEIIAVAIPYWWRLLGFTTHVGLWQICKETCHDISPVNGNILTSRGLHMFGLIAGVVALISYIVCEVKEIHSLKYRRFFGCFLSLIAGAFILIADCYMATQMSMHPACYSMSLIAASFFIFVGGNLSSLVTISE